MTFILAKLKLEDLILFLSRRARWCMLAYIYNEIRELVYYVYTGSGKSSYSFRVREDTLIFLTENIVIKCHTSVYSQNLAHFIHYLYTN